MAVFWVVAPCNLVEVYQRFGGTCCLHHQSAMTSETLANFYQTRRRYNPEDSHLRTHHRENLKSYYYYCLFSMVTKLWEVFFQHFTWQKSDHGERAVSVKTCVHVLIPKRFLWRMLTIWSINPCISFSQINASNFPYNISKCYDQLLVFFFSKH
jgi:hypothetical protein